jgi:hypothetical protein
MKYAETPHRQMKALLIEAVIPMALNGISAAIAIALIFCVGLFVGDIQRGEQATKFLIYSGAGLSVGVLIAGATSATFFLVKLYRHRN